MFNPFRAVRSGYDSVGRFLGAIRDAFLWVASIPQRLMTLAGQVARAALISFVVVGAITAIALVVMIATRKGQEIGPPTVYQHAGVVHPPVVEQRTYAGKPVAPAFAPVVEPKKQPKKVHVDAYERKDGTKVREHTRTIPAR